MISRPDGYISELQKTCLKAGSWNLQ